jgi:hypothetical protein
MPEDLDIPRSELGAWEKVVTLEQSPSVLEQVWQPLRDFVLKQQAALDAVKHIKGGEQVCLDFLKNPNPSEALSFESLMQKAYLHHAKAFDDFRDEEVEDAVAHLVHAANYIWMAAYKAEFCQPVPVV